MRGSCENCHQQPATVHLCEIVYGKQTVLNLCEACFRSRFSYVPDADHRNQKCFYCGKPASCGGTNLPWEQEVRKQKYHFYCLRCGKLLHRFFETTTIPKGLTHDEQREALRKMVEEVDRLVREQVKMNTA